MAHRQLGQIFVDLGFIDEQALEKLLIEQQEQRPDEMIGRLADGCRSDYGSSIG